jgi:hypothetical protein
MEVDLRALEFMKFQPLRLTRPINFAGNRADLFAELLIRRVGPSSSV